MGHMVSVSANGEEFGQEEAGHYKAAVDCYQQALSVLGSKRQDPGIWDSVQWELCSTLYTMATLYQDQAPLSTMSRDQVEKLVTDMMSQSLKYCDTDNVTSPRHTHYQASIFIFI